MLPFGGLQKSDGRGFKSEQAGDRTGFSLCSSEFGRTFILLRFESLVVVCSPFLRFVGDSGVNLFFDRLEEGFDRIWVAIYQTAICNRDQNRAFVFLIISPPWFRSFVRVRSFGARIVAGLFMACRSRRMPR